MLHIRVGDLEFVGQDDRPYDDILLVTPDGFTGWDEGTNMRRDETLRPGKHGAFDAPGYLSPRVVSISGEVLCITPERFEHVRAKLTGLLADGDLGRLTVEQDSGTLWADVRLASATAVKENPDMVSGKYQIQFWAADPRKYGLTRPFGPATIVVASHYGNFPAAPLLTVTGSMPSGYTITGPDGRTFVVSQALTSGHTHRIDMRTGRLTLDNVLQVGAVSVGQTWGIPGGVTVTHTLTPVSGSGLLTVTVLDTFI